MASLANSRDPWKKFTFLKIWSAHQVRYALRIASLLCVT